VSLHIPLPMAPGRSRVPAHVAAQESVGGPADGKGADAPARAPSGRNAGAAGGPSTVCRAPFDPAAVPAAALPLWTALRDVLDPELPISVVDMGLIYDARLDGRTAEVTLTYTATGCPCVDFIRTDITERLLEEPGVDSVVLHEVWSPPWTRAMMTEEGRSALRELGVAA
jgi:metal-sulfur cluster biosynthetic enzyme